MKLVYWLVPFLGVTAFATYYHHWNRQQDMFSCPAIPRDPFDEYKDRDGRKEAEADILNGTPKVLTYGLPAHWIGEFGEIMERDYGVKCVAVAGCIVSEPLIKYTEAYNTVIENYLKAVHGAGVMEAVVRKAEALYAERHPPIEPAPAN